MSGVSSIKRSPCVKHQAGQDSHERTATTELVYGHEIRPALTQAGSVKEGAAEPAQLQAQGGEVMDKIFG
jgi:hypothetical protein